MREMTLQAVAGYCYETMLWKLLADLSDELQRALPEGCLTPDDVTLDGEDFHVAPQGQKTPSAFCPPEGGGCHNEAALVWSLGALVCYASSGHCIFGGQGGRYQRSHPTVALPALRKEHAALTPLVRRCLCYSPGQRISLKTLHEQALQGLRTAQQQARMAQRKSSLSAAEDPDVADHVWPDDFE